VPCLSKDRGEIAYMNARHILENMAQILANRVATEKPSKREP
jgi:hypothetical protein